MDSGAERAICFVVAGGDPAEFLDFLKEVLDQMTPFVHLLIVGDLFGATGIGRDHRQGPSRVQRGPQPITVERLVADERVEGDAVQQGLDAAAVVALTRQEKEAHEIAERIDQGHDLGGQAAARLADGLIESPPLRQSRAGGLSRWCRQQGRIRPRGLPTTH